MKHRAPLANRATAMLPPVALAVFAKLDKFRKKVLRNAICALMANPPNAHQMRSVIKTSALRVTSVLLGSIRTPTLHMCAQSVQSTSFLLKRVHLHAHRATHILETPAILLLSTAPTAQIIAMRLKVLVRFGMMPWLRLWRPMIFVTAVLASTWGINTPPLNCVF